MNCNLNKKFINKFFFFKLCHQIYNFRKFAVSMCNKVSEMIQGLATPAHRKLQLIPILQHMHHDISTASMVS